MANTTQREKPLTMRRRRSRLKVVHLEPLVINGSGEAAQNQRSASPTQNSQTPLPEIPMTPSSAPPLTPEPEIPITPEPEVPATPHDDEQHPLPEALPGDAAYIKLCISVMLVGLLALLIVGALALLVYYYVSSH